MLTIQRCTIIVIFHCNDTLYAFNKDLFFLDYPNNCIIVLERTRHRNVTTEEFTENNIVFVLHRQYRGAPIDIKLNNYFDKLLTFKCAFYGVYKLYNDHIILFHTLRVETFVTSNVCNSFFSIRLIN